jgi:DNA-directed RNA polymerase specialized sigma24 family protein
MIDDARQHFHAAARGRRHRRNREFRAGHACRFENALIARVEPLDLADETFRRIRDRLDVGAVVPATSPAHYCFAVAKHVLLEDVGRQGAPTRAGEAWLSADLSTVPGVESDERPARSANQCDVVGRLLDALPPAARQAVVEYYRDPRATESHHRRRIAERMDMTPNELRVRASWLRDPVMGVSHSSGSVFRVVAE